MHLLYLVLVSWAGADSHWLDVEDQIARLNENRKDCGPLCAWAFLTMKGHSVTLDGVKSQTALGPEGTEFRNVLQAIQQFEPKARIVRAPPSALELLPTPFVLVVHHQHSIVVTSVDAANGQVLIFEPSTMKLGPESLERIEQVSSGMAIVVGSPALSTTQYWAIASLCGLLTFLAGLKWTAVSARQRSSPDPREPAVGG
jgi:ABC-type bacteriocin/lantibiotic exporter with double-glycine peptidase domain